MCKSFSLDVLYVILFNSQGMIGSIISIIHFEAKGLGWVEAGNIPIDHERRKSVARLPFDLNILIQANQIHHSKCRLLICKSMYYPLFHDH